MFWIIIGLLLLIFIGIPIIAVIFWYLMAGIISVFVGVSYFLLHPLLTFRHIWSLIVKNSPN